MTGPDGRPSLAVGLFVPGYSAEGHLALNKMLPIPLRVEVARTATDDELYEALAAGSGTITYEIAADELQRRLLKRLETQAGRLADSSVRMEGLTKSLNRLTIALIVLAVVQIVFFVWSISK